MKIYTSYFYQIRFFKPNMIPLSTAKFDPKWFQKGEPWKDKNGVYNGLRAEPFVPGPITEGTCFGMEGCHSDPDHCDFLMKYRWQLNQLDFQDILKRFERMGNHIQSLEGFEEEPILVLIVHEKPSQRCSERTVLHKWFADNGYPITELEYPL